MSVAATRAPENRLDRFLEKWADRCNAILVKETRQAVKSRQFVVTFLLLLAAAWIVSAFAVVVWGRQIEYGRTGQAFFSAYYTVLAAAIFLVVPFGAYRSLQAEREENTFELLTITTLSPGQVVWGKLLGAFVQTCIYYSAIAPFLAFTTLLQGVDLLRMLFVLAAAMPVSLFLCMVCLYQATLVKQRIWQFFMTLFLMGQLVWGLIYLIVASVAAQASPLPFDQPEFWWTVGITVLSMASYFVLLFQMAKAKLTFESDNRSTGIRAVATGQFWLLWIGAVAWCSFQGPRLDSGVVVLLAVLSALHWFVFGLFEGTEPDVLSRRVRRNLPENPALRLLLWPLLPGGARGYVLAVGHLALLVVVVGLLQILGLVDAPYSRSDTVLAGTAGICLYVVVYLSIAAAIARWGRQVSPEFKPAAARVLTVLCGTAAMIAPMIVEMMVRNGFRGYNLMHVANPFWSVGELFDARTSSAGILALVVVAAVLGLLVNAVAVVRSFLEILHADVKPRTAPVPTAASDPFASPA